MNAKPWTLAIAALAVIGCGTPVNEDAAVDARGNDARANDSATPSDTGSPEDSAVAEDSGVDLDTGVASDSGVAMDARTDAPTGRDVATDSRTDARADSGVADTGTGADAGLALMNVPTCTTANVTAAQLYMGVVTTSCTGARCHDPGTGGMLSMGSAAQMRTNLLMRSSRAAMARVTPRDLNNSYLMYKLLNQHMRVPGGAGNRMPPSGSLGNTQLCLFVNWIRSGAM